jgi:Flp pilus assembly protein TadD
MHTFCNLFYAYNLDKKFEETIKLNGWATEKLLVDESSDTYYLFHRNYIYALIQNEKYYPDALLEIRKSVELDPTDPEIWYLWGRMLFEV